MSHMKLSKWIPEKTDQDRLRYMECSGGIMLEPRLQEYLKKKRYYVENNIYQSVPVEKEYQITNTDLQLIKMYFSGDKDIYNKDKYSKITGIKTSYESNKNDYDKKKYFPSKSFRDGDERVPDTRDLQVRKNANMRNMGMFVPDEGQQYYDENLRDDNLMMDSRDFPEFNPNGFDIKNSRFRPTIDPKIDPGKEIYNKESSPYYIDNKTYDPDPRNKRIISNLKNKIKNEKNTVSNQSNFSSIDNFGDNILGNSYYDDNYGTFSNSNEDDENHMSTLDVKNKVVIPKLSNTAKRGQESNNYRFEFGPGVEVRNAELENELMRGMPSYRPKNKSYGYRNPSENYFDYVDMDFQNPVNSVESWSRGGAATRLENRQIAKNNVYTREMM